MLLTLLQRSVQPHTTMNNLGQNKKPWCQVMLPPWTNHVHGAKGPTGVSFLCACYTGSVVSDSVRPYGLQPIKAPLSMGFPRQEYWSCLPFPSPGDLPNPGIELTSLMSSALAGAVCTASTTWEALKTQDTGSE